MVLWLGLAVLTAAVLAVVLRPLMLPAATADADGTADVAVYRDQLRELDAERARGLISDSEADAARAEIARRLLASAGSTPADEPSPPVHDSSLMRAAPVAVCLAVPLMAVSMYLLLGSPGMPDYPLAARLNGPPASNDIAALVGRVEARLREHPQDGQGWDVIAPVYFRQGRYQEAADAFARAAALLGETTERLAGFAEATVRANDGVVTESARRAYEKLAKLEPKRIEPRFWLALAAEQDGRLPDAAEAYAALLKEAGESTPWRKPLSDRLAAVRARMSPKSAAGESKLPGPTAEDVAAAGKMSPAEQAQFIDGMVQGLAERLRASGGDLASWKRLIRAYTVLGRKQEAAAALTDARRGLANEPSSLSELDAFAKSLGLES